MAIKSTPSPAQIWENPELAYEEHIAHDTLCDLLEGLGFQVTRHAYGLDTSFEVQVGSGGRLINFNAEYDALPDIGHACGHNLIATASLTAFLATASLLEQTKLPGRAQLLGTPAEEHGGGKLDLLKAGAYEGVDASLMSHPMPQHYYADKYGCDGAAGIRLIAKQTTLAEYRGRTAHSAANPWDGVNALDAMVASYNNVSMLRQQIRPDERIHAGIVHAPERSNIIADLTQITWQSRAPQRKSLKKLVERVNCCLGAASIATGCEVTVKQESAYADLLVNGTMSALYLKHMAGYGQKILQEDPECINASSDVGDVSYALPAMHPIFGIPVKEKGVVTHHRSFTEAAGTDTAHEIAVTVGKGLALCAWDILTNDQVHAAIRADWKRATTSALAGLN